MKNKVLLLLPVLLLSGVFRLFGDDASKDGSKEITTAAAPQAPAFRAGANEVELLGGGLVSLDAGKRRDRPTLDYAVQSLRYDWMLNDVHCTGFWRGNEELVLEGFGGEVFKGPHGGFGGGLLAIRHNFVEDASASRIVPYIQFGAGALGNDIFHDKAQTRVGEEFEFTIHGGLGIRWMISDRWAISTEAQYRHISNAGLSSRNSGLDSFGGAIGFNYLY
jgi:hypothetical protein